MEPVCRRTEKTKGVRAYIMYNPNIKRKRSGAPVLSRVQIDEIGERLVHEFNADALKSPQEMDIDLFVQDYLGMDQDFQYLSHCGLYLGVTVFNDTDKVPVYDPKNNRADYISAKAHTVIIDKTLLVKNQEHRYRFTMGHEASHEFLHKEYFYCDPQQIHIFDFIENTQTPMIQCRIDTKKINTKPVEIWTDREWMEWQANALSSAILMPKSMVEVVIEQVNNRNEHKRLLYYAFACKVSSVFNVSFEAAAIRLKHLGYIPMDEYVDRNTFNLVHNDIDN